MNTFTELVSMYLHEEILVGDFYITRVVGGWIYTRYYESSISCTFVPGG